MRCVFIILVFVTLSFHAQARPVSYPGGWTGMFMNDGDKHSAHVHYTLDRYTSLGYKLEYWRDSEMTLNMVQLNKLLKRWNAPQSQGNLYFKSGAGIAYSDRDDFDGEIDPAGFAGIAADWENRRFFVSYENRYTEAGDQADFFMQSARVGIAPYIGDYGDLHTWLMLQAEHAPESDEPVVLTPLIRMFKGVHLIEAGLSSENDILFNYVVRY